MQAAAVPASNSENGGPVPANGGESSGRCPVDHEALARMGVTFEDVMKEPQKYAHLMNGAANSTVQANGGNSRTNGSLPMNGDVENGKCPVDHEALAAQQVQPAGMLKLHFTTRVTCARQCMSLTTKNQDQEAWRHSHNSFHRKDFM